nr:molecular chaperone HtpG [Lachnospiraceae bacterium]
ILTVSEESRRMQDMMKMYSMGGDMAGMGDMFGSSGTLVLNSNNKLVKFVMDTDDEDKQKLFCEQLYDLAVLQNQQFTPEAMKKFVQRSNEIMGMLL